MPRLIDADELLEKICQLCGAECKAEDKEKCVEWDFANRAVNRIDAIELVRCKDCKWWNTDEIYKCVAYDAFWVIDADGYCAWGERKSGQRVDESIDK